MKRSFSPLSLGTLAFLAAFTSSPLVAQQRSAVPFDRGVKIEVSSSKPSGLTGDDYDNKFQKIVLRVKFTGLDPRQTFEGYTASISAFGESTLERGVRMVLMHESIPVSVAPMKTQEHECAQVKTRFDKTDAKFGYFYDGWIVVVKDKAGKVVHIKSTSPTFEKLPEKAAKLTKGQCYDRSLEPTKSPGPVYDS